MLCWTLAGPTWPRARGRRDGGPGVRRVQLNLMMQHGNLLTTPLPTVGPLLHVFPRVKYSIGASLGKKRGG